MTPCYTCAKMIINAGIIRVVCEQDYHAGTRSKEIFSEAEVELTILNNVMTTYADMKPKEMKSLFNKNKILNLFLKKLALIILMVIKIK